MAKTTWTLTDQRHGLDVAHWTLDPSAIGTGGGYSVTKRTLTAGRSRGMDVVEVDNGRLRFALLPTRGMGLWRAACGSLQLGWRAPVAGPVHPSLVPLAQPDGLGWLAGFDELMCRCGLESNGAPEFAPDGRLVHGLHGRIANLPAHHLEVTTDQDAGEIVVRGVVDESHLFGNKLRLEATVTTRLGEPRLTIADRITNLSAEPGELQLLYHINFGSPLLTPGARVRLPFERLAPRDAVAQEDVPTWDTYGPETPGSVESVFFARPAADADGNTLAVLGAASGEEGAAVRFNIDQLPLFALWKNRQAAADGYVTGLEPAVNLPNPKSFEKQHGRVIVLQPGETRQFAVTIEALPDAEAVQRAADEVAAIQGDRPSEVLDRPDPDWSAT